jgi:hypothetical protein
VPQQVGRSRSEEETTENEGSFEERGKGVSRDRSGERKKNKEREKGVVTRTRGERERVP